MRNTKRNNALRQLKKDALIIAVSIIFAIALAESGTIAYLLGITSGLRVISSFVAGLFFTSMFTIGPAMVALADIGRSGGSAYEIATWGALGALCGDLIIFSFLRDSVGDDIAQAMKHSNYRNLLSFFHLGFMRLLSPLIGAIIIASPLPDELGLALMGLSKTKTLYVVPISFVMNFIGILSIVLVARAL